MIEAREMSDRELRMEILCTLPKFPLKMSVFDLAKDFGVSEGRIIDALNAAKGAKGAKMPVKFNEVAGEACINSCGWLEMQMMTERFWRQMRGGNSA